MSQCNGVSLDLAYQFCYSKACGTLKLLEGH